MKTILLISFFLASYSYGFSQIYLNDTTYYNGIWCGYNGVFEVDSGYFVMGNVSRNEYNSDLALTLGFFSKNGGKTLVIDDYDTLTNQKNYGSIHDLFLNDRGNFVYFYNNCNDTSGCYPRIKEVSPNGAIIFDSILQPLMDSANLRTLDFNNFIQKKDSSYLLMVNVTDTTRLNSGTQGGGGLFAIHLDENFNLIDSVRYFTSGALIIRNYSYVNMIELDSGKVILLTWEQKQGANPLEEDRVLFIKLDEQGVIIDTSYYSDEQKIIFPYAFTKTYDDGYLFTYLKGNLDGNTWKYSRFLCKVDSSFNFIWKRKIIEAAYASPSMYLMSKDCEKTLDSNYILIGSSDIEDSTIYQQQFAQLIKFDETGNFLWERNHFKVKDTSEIFPVQIEMSDVISTTDSGYCMVGQVFDYPAFGTGAVYKYGYIVKTNCLGFLGNAVASVNYQLEDSTATFYNTSMQAGSYYWDFGDDTTLTTDEYADTVLHTYPPPSPSSASGGGDTYDVMLIAYGCYNSLGVRDADTVLFTVTVTKQPDTNIVVAENGFFVLFPNPSNTGGEFSIYLNALDPNNGEVNLNIYSMDGKLAKKFYLSANEGTYMLDNDLAKGMYQVVLEQGGKGLQGEKLIVH